MIEIKIPKELDNYEAKFFGPFTLRQSVCIVCALPIGVLLFNLANSYVGTNLAGFVCLIPACIAYLFGWLKPYGMKFEVFLKSVFITSFLAPSKRKYKTNNYFKQLMETDAEEEEDLFLDEKKKKKKNGPSSTASVSISCLK